MLYAYVLINTEVGDEEKIHEDMMRIEGIEEVHIVYGVYDIIGKIKAKDMDELKIILERIRRMSGLRSTLTLIVTK
ncbi:Lrp/AsnC ligand binding domain-containing protein [Archaeoglobus neptunius]|uniref:Lrp/AsnC ligand binding domain-containing protein n=1 Tax=Archaeoglobus neptunius TaxID=2798580 RepID=UPI0019271D6A|nr:Lrp/AsnC ligand binding domain-containing protein [Archaeoglobus neptunius]